jgi:hypothetical protein
MTIADMVADPPMGYEALKDGVRCRICGAITKEVDMPHRSGKPDHHSDGCPLKY